MKRVKTFVIALAALVCVISTNPLSAQQKSIVQTAVDAPGFNTLVAAVKAAGGSVKYDHENLDVFAGMQQQMEKPGWVERFFGIDFAHDVVQVDLTNRPVTQQLLDKVSRLPKQRELFTGENNTNDSGLRHLARCSQLEALILLSLKV